MLNGEDQLVSASLSLLPRLEPSVSQKEQPDTSDGLRYQYDACRLCLLMRTLRSRRQALRRGPHKV